MDNTVDRELRSRLKNHEFKSWCCHGLTASMRSLHNPPASTTPEQAASLGGPLNSMA